MEYEVVNEYRLTDKIIIQIVRTNECGGTYYMCVNGILGFHSLDYERIENYIVNNYVIPFSQRDDIPKR